MTPIIVSTPMSRKKILDAPVTPLCCGLLFVELYDASCSVGLLHKKYAAAPIQPVSFATAAPASHGLPNSPSLKLDFFSISMRAPDPTSRPSDHFLPFLPRKSTPDSRNRKIASTPDPEASGRGVKRAGAVEWNHKSPIVIFSQPIFLNI